MKIGKVGKSGGGGRFVFDCPKTNGEVQLNGFRVNYNFYGGQN